MPTTNDRTQGASTGSVRGTEAAGRPAGFWIDLNHVQLFDPGQQDNVTWIQAMPLGTYTHPVYGKIEVTPERVQRFASNVMNKIRGTDLDIDYDHKERDGRAAGWVREAEARDDGLWISVEWTEQARNAVANKEYRYFSPEFTDAWEHPKTGEKYQDVLFGGALTNRPFLKDILPINMSEVMEANEGGNRVDRTLMESIARRLGVQFDEKTSDEDLLTAITAAAESDPGDGGEGGEGEGEGGQSTTTGTPIAASETDPELIKLAETNPAIAAMLAERVEQNKRLHALEAANRLSEVNVKLSDDSLKVIPPAIKEQVRDLATTLPKAFSDKVIDLITNVARTGLVELGERGGKGSAASGGASATKQFNDKIEALRKDKNMSFADAATQVAAQDEDLFAAYLAEQAEGVTL